MRLVSLHVENFRSIDDVTVRFGTPHSVLVGGNNAGKSNLLTAVEWVLGSQFPRTLSRNAAAEDFHDPGRPIQIEATLGDVSAADKRSLFSVASNQRQKGALNGKEPADVTVSIALSLPAFSASPVDEDAEAADDEGARSATLIVSLWGFTVRQKTADLRQRLVYSFLVEPNRIAKDELTASRWTSWGRLAKEILEDSPEYPEVQRTLSELNEAIQSIFETQKEKILKDARLVSYVEDIEFRLTRDNNPAELLRNLEIFIHEGGRGWPIERTGTGTQNAVVMSMMELVLRSRNALSKVFAIEEPEAFVNPSGVRRLGRLAKEIADESSAQVLISSHSPTLLASLSPADVIRVEKSGHRTSVFHPSSALADAHFGRYVNQETAEMFFARRVILVEGQTEKFLLPPLSRVVMDGAADCDFDRLHNAVISMDGKPNLLNYLQILDEFKIDRRVVLDADFLGDSTCGQLVTYLRTQGATVDDSADNRLRTTLRAAGIAVLTNGEIEDYILDADVVAVSGQSASAVSGALAGAPKRSVAFKQIFGGVGKPQIGRAFGEYYAAGATVPTQLAQLVVWLATATGS